MNILQLSVTIVIPGEDACHFQPRLFAKVSLTFIKHFFPLALLGILLLLSKTVHTSAILNINGKTFPLSLNDQMKSYICIFFLWLLLSIILLCGDESNISILLMISSANLKLHLY